MTAPNTDPVYSLGGNLTQDNANAMNAGVTAAANDYDGSSANNSLIFTAGAQGSWVARIKLKAKGTNVASVMRFYLNNGSSPTVAANNQFIGEISLPATTATIVAATIELEYPLGIALKSGQKLYMGLGTAVSAGWVATVVGGNY